MEQRQSASMTYIMRGAYSSERDQSHDIQRYLGNRNIDDFIEESMRTVSPYTHVRITVEVFA